MITMTMSRSSWLFLTGRPLPPPSAPGGHNTIIWGKEFKVYFWEPIITVACTQGLQRVRWWTCWVSQSGCAGGQVGFLLWLPCQSWGGEGWKNIEISCTFVQGRSCLAPLESPCEQEVRQTISRKYERRFWKSVKCKVPILSLRSVILLKDGQVVAKKVGLKPPQKLSFIWIQDGT